MPHIFVSYARSDAWEMRAVRYWLFSEGFRVWADETGLKPGTDDWREALWTALQDSGCVVTICTPSARSSTWVGDELERALNLGRPVFALLVKGDPETSLHARLKWIQHIDARQHFQGGMRELAEAIDDRSDSVNVRRTGTARRKDELRWDRVGSVFWFASEGRKLRLQLLTQSVPLEEIERGLLQLRHHARRLNADRFVVREVDLILQEIEHAGTETLSEGRRAWHSDRLRVAFDTVARRAEDADPDFDPGPRWT
jgi:hypothetical protein